MNQDQKQQIIDQALSYMTQNGLTQNNLSTLTGINSGYLNPMLKSVFFTTSSNNHKVEIPDKWFMMLAEKIGGNHEKSYWETIPTAEFLQMITALESFKKTSKSGMLIGPTGMGKTYTCDKFVTKHPLHSYKVTVNELHTLGDILNDLLSQMGGDIGGSNFSKMEKLMMKLRMLKRQGAKPIIILDEFENAKSPLIKTIKSLYDGVKGYCSIVLIGTDQLPKRLARLKSLDKDGMPQFWRRFKAGRRTIESMQRKDFNAFMEKYKIEKGLRSLLNNLCDNYGELNDYLEPAIREAEIEGVPLTEEFFRLMYNMPKFS